MNSSTPGRDLVVASFYRFAPLATPDLLRRELAAFACAHGIRGTILLASEGINGTVAGAEEAIGALVERLRTVPGLESLQPKLSRAAGMPFRRMKVRLKAEIVTMGVAGIDAAAQAGAHVEPADWNALIAAPDTVAIDTRNDYEVAIGSFLGARDPAIRSFRAFPEWLDRHAGALAGKRLAMFCTGGIRCEKATAYARRRGFGEVFHLRGGILRYLEEVPAGESLWRGECFVFDERVALGQGLRQGEAVLCRACRRPLAPDDLRSPHYREGVSCARCIGEHSDADRARFAERQRQFAR